MKKIISSQQKAYSGLLCASLCLYIITAFYISIKYLLNSNYLMALLGPVSLLFLLIPPIARKIIKIEMGPQLISFMLLFIMIAFEQGIVLRWYEIIPFYDRIAHFISGFFFSIIGFCFYSRLNTERTDRKKNAALQMMFALAFSMMIAGLWELGEYARFLITGNDAQHVLETGVGDTMYDMFACLLGSIFMCYDFWRNVNGKKMILTHMVKEFDLINNNIENISI